MNNITKNNECAFLVDKSTFIQQKLLLCSERQESNFEQGRRPHWVLRKLPGSSYLLCRLSCF